MASKIILDDAQNICDRINFDCLSDTTILVTGASGLIGTYFLACLSWLHENGARIRVYAQIFSEPPPHTSELVYRSGFEIIKVNLADFAEYPRLPKADVIIHSAGYAQPIRFMADPIATIQINTSATIALLRRLRKNGRFLFLSSSEIYCGLENSLFQETAVGTTSPFHPRASYIEGKRCGEAICNGYASQGVHAPSVRLGDVYGPGTRKHDKRALNSFIEKGLCHHKIELMDAGTATRTYCYVADAVELLWQILLYGKERVYNVGGRFTVTIAELAKMIGKIIGVRVIFPSTKVAVPGAPKELRLDLTRVEKEFGKNKYVSLKEGLKKTIEWQRELYLQ
jgi:nucleoside-diphosphate-sugar epimerase